MGRAYSVNGYLNAALLRTGKTMLVEGPSDKHSLHRISVERYPDFVGGASIDHAGMLDDPQLSGLGNKERVLLVHRCASALRGTIPKIGQVLATLTDREWDGVACAPYAPTPSWAPPAQTHNQFVTMGHSIENYHFDVACAKGYLKYAFSEYVSAPLLADLDSMFPALMVLSTVLSIRIRDCSCISRSSDLLDIQHLRVSAGRFYLEDSFALACQSRGITSAATIVGEVNDAIDREWDRLYRHAAIQWLPHGHIGDGVVWVGVSFIAKAAGVSSAVATSIATGYKKERERFVADWLSKADRGSRVPLDQSIDWLHS